MNHPADAKKMLQKAKKKKLTNSIKVDLYSCPLIPLIFIKRYTRSIIFVMFCQKLSNSWIYLWTHLLEVHWRCLQNIALQNPKNKKLPISLKYVLESCPFKPNIFINRYTWSIKFEKIRWKLSDYWTYSKINLASSHNPKNPLRRLFKTVCNKLFFLNAIFF